MNRVIHFEICADDPERAATFYRTVFGWTIGKWEGPVDYWLAGTGDGPGIDGALMHRPEPGMHTVNTIVVEDVRATLEQVRAQGGTIRSEPQAVPGIGWHAYCEDTEGNVFGVMQEDASAQ